MATPSQSGFSPRSLLIMTAMSVEEEAIKNLLPLTEKIQVSKPFAISVEKMQAKDRQILLTNSGIGLVNSGIAAALILQTFSVDAILLLGVAGALSPGLDIGQMVLATHIIQHDSFFSGDEGDELMAPGHPYVSIPKAQRKDPVFETDRSFSKWLLSTTSQSMQSGILLSGSEFVGRAKRKLALAKGALAVEMEAAAVAQVAQKISIPFAVVKTIADRVHPDQSIALDYNRFVDAAAENCASLMTPLLKTFLA